jgi:RNA recognition motif-containing protein
MNIYVAHLSWGTTNDSLQSLFSQFGEVTSANIITDRETGRSRGFGFVDMPSDEDGQKAIDQLNNTDFEGQTIAVSVARPRTERSAGPRGGFGGGRGGFGGNRGGGFNRGGNRGGYGNRDRGFRNNDDFDGGNDRY